MTIYKCTAFTTCALLLFFFFSSRRRHTRFDCDWSSDVCSSDLLGHHDPRHRVSAAGDHGRVVDREGDLRWADRKSTRLNSSHSQISYAVFCLKKKKKRMKTINRQHSVTN